MPHRAYREPSQPESTAESSAPQHAHDHSEPFDVTKFLTQEFWDERYSSAPAVWSGRANPVLVREVTGLPAGTALDVGAGEGGDAIWLATQGWAVTAVDLSPVALERAATMSRSAGADVAERITWKQADALAWAPDPGAYDLVTAQFLHLPRAELEAVHLRLAAAVRPGGTFLVVNHHPVDNDALGRPPMPGMFTLAEEMATFVDPAEWAVIEASAPTRPVTIDGREVMITDTVLRAVRTS